MSYKLPSELFGIDIESEKYQTWNKTQYDLIQEFFDSITVQDDPYTAIAKDDITILLWDQQYAGSEFEIVREEDATGKERFVEIVAPAFFIVSDAPEYVATYIELEEDIPDRFCAIVHVPKVRLKYYIPDDYTVLRVGDSKLFVLHYKPEDYVFTVIQTVLTAATIVQNINKLYAYRKIDYPHRLLYVLLDLIGDIAPVDLVHYELFISELVRCGVDPKLPARLCPENKYLVLSQKKVPHISSPIRAIVFENYGEAIMHVLLGETATKLSTLDKLIIQDYENLDKKE